MKSIIQIAAVVCLLVASLVADENICGDRVKNCNFNIANFAALLKEGVRVEEACMNFKHYQTCLGESCLSAELLKEEQGNALGNMIRYMCQPNIEQHAKAVSHHACFHDRAFITQYDKITQQCRSEIMTILNGARSPDKVCYVLNAAISCSGQTTALMCGKQVRSFVENQLKTLVRSVFPTERMDMCIGSLTPIDHSTMNHPEVKTEDPGYLTSFLVHLMERALFNAKLIPHF